MIYLASTSARRAELLTQIGITFSLVDGTIDEVKKDAESPEHYVRRLAREKAQCGFKNSDGKKPVLGADTLIVFKNKIFEKPKDRADAKTMLRLLSANTHQVFTAISVVCGLTEKTELIKTEVTFKALTDLEIDDYWLTKEPLGKAAGYAIQGIAGKFVTKINGSYSAVVGLPLYETEQLLNEFEE